MADTRIAVRGDPVRARVELSCGAGPVLVPRLISRTRDRAQVALVAGGALLLGGDHLVLEVDVGDGCLLELTEVAGTVAYGADGAASSVTVHIRLGRGAVVLWLGLELVVAEGADTRRELTVELADGAIALIRETTVLGRTGEAGGRVVTASSYRTESAPVLVESLELCGDRPVPGIAGGHRVIDTMVLAGLRPRAGDGAFALEQPGALARHLGGQTHQSPIPELFGVWRAEVLKESDR